MASGRSFLAAFACALSLLAGAGADKAFLGASAPQTGVVETPTALVEASSAVENDSKDEPKDGTKKAPKEEEKEEQKQEKEEKEQKQEKEEKEEHQGDCLSNGNPMLNTVLNMAPQCFQLCPKMCSAIKNVLGKFSGVPGRSVIQDQVCKFKDEFSCALQEGNKKACEAVLTPAAAFDVPQSSSQLSQLCGTVAHDIKPKDAKDAKDATSSATQLRGATVMAAGLLLASALQHLA